MFSINLVPEVQQQKQKVAKRNTLGTIIAIAIIGLCAATLLIMGGIKIAKTNQLSNTNKEIERIEQESEKYKELEEIVVSLEKGLAGVNEINDGKYTWTMLLTHIENATPQDVQYTNLSLDGNNLNANLRGKSIDSLARYIKSFKEYKVVSIGGAGEVGEKIQVSIDGGSETTVIVKSNETWTHALSFDPTKDHSIKIIKNGEEFNVSYLKDTKRLTTPENYDVDAKVSNLFTSVETTQYIKEGSQVSFNATITFSGELIW